jgi:hypothetical protein
MKRVCVRFMRRSSSWLTTCRASASSERACWGLGSRGTWSITHTVPSVKPSGVISGTPM